MLKRTIYIIAFTLLGLLVGALVVGLMDVTYLRLLASDITRYSFGLRWSGLVGFNDFFATVMILICGYWGFSAGKFWWQQIYVLKKYRRNAWKKVIY